MNYEDVEQIRDIQFRVHDVFLNKCRKEHTSLEIVTTTGEIIEGVIDCYDKDTIIVHNEMAQMMIFKHSISYISPRSGKQMIKPENSKWDDNYVKKERYLCAAR